MQMIISGAGIPCIADVGDRLALGHDPTLAQTVCITIQMSVVVNKLLIVTELVDGHPAGFALKQS